jgi:hypothetical protein
MKNLAASVILVGLVLLIAFLIVVFALKEFLIANADLIVVAKDLTSVLGLSGLVIVAATFISSERARREREQENEQARQENRKLERVRLSTDLMSRFYGPQELEKIRRALREHEPLRRSAGHPFSLRWDEVWVMNFFETLAICVEEGLLDIKLVDKMFGSPILEVAVNPSLRQLVYDEEAEEVYSYEGYIRTLYLPICKIRRVRPQIKIREQGGT